MKSSNIMKVITALLFQLQSFHDNDNDNTSQNFTITS
jgi:hypothetical protein